MKISPITNLNFYKSNSHQKKSTYKGQAENINDSAERLELINDYLDENYNDAYNIEYTPVKKEGIYSGPSGSMVLPSQRHIHNKSTFRDEELFDENSDITYYYGPEKYDIDDVPIRESLWMKYVKNNANEHHYGIDTNISAEEINFYDTLQNPWESEDSRLDQERESQFKTKSLNRIRKVPGSNIEIAKSILKSATIVTNGKLTLNENLCNLAIELYKNSKEWSGTEKSIMKSVKIPLYQSVYIGYNKTKYKAVINLIMMDYPNEKILDYLNRRHPGTYEGLDKIFTREELESLM